MIDDRDRSDVVILAAIGDEYDAVLAVDEGAAPGILWRAFLRERLPDEARPAIVAPAPDCGRLPRSARTMVQRRASAIRPASMSGCPS